jgi:serine/threonine protein kinase
MARDSKPSVTPPTRPKTGIDVQTSGDVALVTVSGLVDEHFAGFGSFGNEVKSLVISVSAMTRMTSFGVRQWLKGMDALPKSIGDRYLLGCPTFFVDQLNMVLNFGGACQVLTVTAPYACPSCGVEAGETIDVLADRASLAKGGIPEKQCSRCGAKLEFDETPESYFSFVNKYAATSIHPNAAQLLAVQGLYTALDVAAEKPPRITKLVHGSVTYFRIVGTIGSMFRARPFLVGAEGEVVIDLAEVDRFDPLGIREWKRLLKTLAAQVPTVTLVDVNDSFLGVAGDSLAIARNIAVWSVLAPYTCIECGRTTSVSQSLEGASWPLQFPEHVCPTCGGATRNELAHAALAPLQKAATNTPPASAKLITQREEILSRAVTDAKVASAGDAASAAVGDDTILGKYQIVRRLSAGGMAEVFLAKQIGIGGFEKPVALKRIQRQLLESRHLAVDMFLNEAKIAGRLMHPNIVQVLDVGEVGGALYLAMEYVRGKDLREVAKRLRSSRSTMPLGVACYVVSEVAQALHHAYWSTDMAGKRLNVVHRDVSPHNIILSFDGTVKLLDFGVAMSSVTEQQETMIVGKWQYMSPEHTTNQPLDHRSDLFSLGVILYLLCTGNMPFTGKEPREIVAKIRAGTYKPLQQAAPDVPQGVADLVSQLLAQNPDDRPQTGREVVNAIAELTRSSGIEASAPLVSRFLADMFPDDRGDAPRIVELVRGRPEDNESLATKKVAVGSGPTQTQHPESLSPSPVSGVSGSGVGAGSGSAPLRGNRYTPPVGVVDVSVSLARRSQEFSQAVGRNTPSSTPSADTVSAPAPGAMGMGKPLPKPLPQHDRSWVALLVAVVLVAAAAVAAYLIVRP